MAGSSFGRTFTIAMAALLLIVAGAIAQEPGGASVELGPWLVGVNGGAVFPMATSFSGKGAIDGLNINATGNLNFRPGPTFTGFTSYELNNYVAVAGQLGYATTKFDNFQGTLALAGVGSITSKFAVSGNSDIIYGFVDGIITPLGGGRTATFVPLIGGGIGFASSSTTFGSVGLPGAALPVGITNHDTNFAMVGVVGAEYRISQRAYLGLGYQFVRVNGEAVGGGGGFSGQTGALRVNIISALFEYRF
jgi:opacity protein-like surface antigen